MKNPKSLTPHQRDVVEQIETLRRMTLLTGFRTTRSQNQILSQLSGEDLAAVAAVVYATHE